MMSRPSTGAIILKQDHYSYCNGIVLKSIIIPSANQPVKRSVNYQGINPIAWIGSGIAKIFGFPTTYDIEDLAAHTARENQTFNAARTITNLHEPKINEAIQIINTISTKLLPDFYRNFQASKQEITAWSGHVNQLLSSLWTASIINMCHTEHLHTEIVPSEKLKEILLPISLTSFSLIFPDFGDFYEYPLITCHVNSRTTIIHLIIPITTPDAKDWELIELKVIPFTKARQICTLNIKQGIYANCHGSLWENNVNRKLCHPSAESNCVIFSYSKLKQLYDSCENVLFRNSTIKSFHDKCKVTCEPQNED